VLAAVKAAGFDIAQYNMACSGLASMPDEIPDAVLGAITAASADAKVTLCALSATWNMIHPDQAQRARGHSQFRILAAAAKHLGIPLLTLCTGTRDPHDQWRHHRENNTPAAWRDLLAAMEQAIVVAEDHGLQLGIEPELANVVNSAAKAKALLAELASPALRIVLDPANLFETETLREQRYIIAQAVDLLGEWLAMAHAKDRTANGSFVAAGTGVLDYRHFIRELRNAAFDGPLVAHGLEATEAPAVAAFLAQNLEQA
jgi:sugar phosphate isomerase/epimerase